MDIVECVLKDTVFFHVHGFKKKQNKKKQNKTEPRNVVIKILFPAFHSMFSLQFWISFGVSIINPFSHVYTTHSRPRMISTTPVLLYDTGDLQSSCHCVPVSFLLTGG